MMPRAGGTSNCHCQATVIVKSDYLTSQPLYLTVFQGVVPDVMCVTHKSLSGIRSSLQHSILPLQPFNPAGPEHCN